VVADGGITVKLMAELIEPLHVINSAVCNRFRDLIRENNIRDDKNIVIYDMSFVSIAFRNNGELDFGRVNK
jgi:hypothetical protein